MGDQVGSTPTWSNFFQLWGTRMKDYRPLSWGNSKISRKIGCFSLLPGTGVVNGTQGTCPLDCPGCYTKGLIKRYETVRDKWTLNTLLARTNPGLLRESLCSQIESRRVPIKAIRIHVAGDFFSQEYLEMWVQIAKKYPMLTFYGYSKSPIALGYNGYPKNMVIHSSLVGDQGINYGDTEYIQKLHKKLDNSWICPCGPGNQVICGETCSKCINRSAGFPLFIQH